MLQQTPDFIMVEAGMRGFPKGDEGDEVGCRSMSMRTPDRNTSFPSVILIALHYNRTCHTDNGIHSARQGLTS